MTYLRNYWVNGGLPARSAENLNKQEVGIEDAHLMYEEGFGAAAATVINVGESTTSDTYGNLATFGPLVSAQIGFSGKALVFVSAQIQSATGGAGSMGFQIEWGVNDVQPPSDLQALRAQLQSGAYGAFTKMSLVTGLPAQTTFDFIAKYKSDSGVSVLFNSRSLVVIPL